MNVIYFQYDQYLSIKLNQAISKALFERVPKYCNGWGKPHRGFTARGRCPLVPSTGPLRARRGSSRIACASGGLRLA
eukprot:8250420-Pyramimonas_sp.AAC.1